MHPGLAARANLEPHATHLARLAERDVSLPEALLVLAAHHQGTGAPRASLRTTLVATAHGTFVHPDDVPALLAGLFHGVGTAFTASSSVEEDVAAAAFLAWGVMAIHPFDDRNGHTAVDVAHYALMLRWRAPVPPLALPKDAASTLGSLFAGVDDRCDGSAEGLVALRARVAARVLSGPHPGDAEPALSAALLSSSSWLLSALPAAVPASLSASRRAP